MSVARWISGSVKRWISGSVVWGLLATWPLGHFVTGPLVYAEELPLPADVESQGLHAPYAVQMGAKSVNMQMFTTSLTIEQLRTFYEDALPKQGWQLTPPAWAAQLQGQLAKLEQVRKEHPEIDTDPAFKEKLAALNPERAQESMRRVIYAARGKDQLVLNLSPQDRKTVVFVNRWQEPASDGSGLPVGPPAPQATWPEANPCCSGGESVPAGLRKLPNSIPQYPNARMISTGAAPPQGALQGAMSEVYLTRDSADQVVDYYRRQMAYNGWSEKEESVGMPAQAAQFLGTQTAQVTMKALRFQNDRGMCSVSVAEDRTPLPDALQSAAASSREPERTIILVHYIELSLLKQPFGEAPRPGGRGAKR